MFILRGKLRNASCIFLQEYCCIKILTSLARDLFSMFKLLIFLSKLPDF